jgi:hypothetical protein
MSDWKDNATDSWKSVGDDFSRLGDSFKKHYTGDETQSDTASEVKDALTTLGQGLDRLFGAVGEAVKDDEVKETARKAGTSLLDALGDTFTSAAMELRDAFKGSQRADTTTIEVEIDDAMEAAEREIDDADAVEEIRSDLDE